MQLDYLSFDYPAVAALMDLLYSILSADLFCLLNVGVKVLEKVLLVSCFLEGA